MVGRGHVAHALLTTVVPNVVAVAVRRGAVDTPTAGRDLGTDAATAIPLDGQGHTADRGLALVHLMWAVTARRRAGSGLPIRSSMRAMTSPGASLPSDVHLLVLHGSRPFPSSGTLNCVNTLLKIKIVRAILCLGWCALRPSSVLTAISFAVITVR